jgi:hypothetical protein
VLITLLGFRVLEIALADRSDYDRGLWEGAFIATLMNIGSPVARWILACVDTRARKRTP